MGPLETRNGVGVGRFQAKSPLTYFRTLYTLNLS